MQIYEFYGKSKKTKAHTTIRETANSYAEALRAATSKLVKVENSRRILAP